MSVGNAVKIAKRVCCGTWRHPCSARFLFLRPTGNWLLTWGIRGHTVGTFIGRPLRCRAASTCATLAMRVFLYCGQAYFGLVYARIWTACGIRCQAQRARLYSDVPHNLPSPHSPCLHPAALKRPSGCRPKSSCGRHVSPTAPSVHTPHTVVARPCTRHHTSSPFDCPGTGLLRTSSTPRERNGALPSLVTGQHQLSPTRTPADIVSYSQY